MSSTKRLNYLIVIKDPPSCESGKTLKIKTNTAQSEAKVRGRVREMSGVKKTLDKSF